MDTLTLFHTRGDINVFVILLMNSHEKILKCSSLPITFKHRQIQNYRPLEYSFHEYKNFFLSLFPRTFIKSNENIIHIW